MKFGRWTVIKKAYSKDGVYWWCKCICGTERAVKAAALKNGTSVSCGCYNRERTKEVLSETKKLHNKYDLSNDYGIGWTNDGTEFFFDKEDYDLIYPYCWHINDSGYLVASYNSKHKRVRMHRLIMHVTSPKQIVDHISHNTLDNRKINLRVVTQSLNTANGKLRVNNPSGYTGVRWREDRKKWNAYITVNYKNISLGHYDTKEDAIEARKKGEEKYFKDYSYNQSMKMAEKNKIKD